MLGPVVIIHTFENLCPHYFKGQSSITEHSPQRLTSSASSATAPSLGRRTRDPAGPDAGGCERAPQQHRRSGRAGGAGPGARHCGNGVGGGVGRGSRSDSGRPGGADGRDGLG
ncbi:translation initiation factor IF-2-like [Peromyscus leucopus]|uniref:translation initiation factor IF-2-like n=1 Tax=Peromyscus leucopus TaxID=10041 RepID=UPI0018855F80|nr:translation initiation factor IF-2-like [Peromyscus leucopus]